jgi:hypothetical protein
MIKEYLKQVSMDPFYDPGEEECSSRDRCVNSLLVNPATKLVLLLSVECDLSGYYLTYIEGDRTLLFHVLRRSFPRIFKMVVYRHALILQDPVHFEVAARELTNLCKTLKLSWIPQLINESTMSFVDIWFHDPVPEVMVQFHSLTHNTRIF